MLALPVQLIVAPLVKKNVTPVPVIVGEPLHEKLLPDTIYMPGGKFTVPPLMLMPL
jgi:hypothetical protein